MASRLESRLGRFVSAILLLALPQILTSIKLE